MVMEVHGLLNSTSRGCGDGGGGKQMPRHPLHIHLGYQCIPSVCGSGDTSSINSIQNWTPSYVKKRQ